NRVEGIYRDGRVETVLGIFPARLDLPEGGKAFACIRPQALSLSGPDEGLPALVVNRSFLGEIEQLLVRIEGITDLLRLRTTSRIDVKPGEPIHLTIDAGGVLIFAAA
ncbi:MAG: TOBE domain-containing protein, partial [Mesorhizobium sp.]